MAIGSPSIEGALELKRDSLYRSILPPNLVVSLLKLAELEHKPLSNVVEEAVKEYIFAKGGELEEW